MPHEIWKQSPPPSIEKPWPEEHKHAVLLEAIMETQRKIEAAGHATMREIVANTQVLKEAAYKLQLLHYVITNLGKPKDALDSSRRLPPHKKGKHTKPPKHVVKSGKLRSAKRGR